jgi:hypothetical protein
MSSIHIIICNNGNLIEGVTELGYEYYLATVGRKMASMHVHAHIGVGCLQIIIMTLGLMSSG